VREPERRGVLTGIVRKAVPMREVFAYIWENRATFLRHNIGFALLSLAAYSSGAWVPEFFRRTYHWPIPKTGMIYGIIVAIAGSAGLVVAGRMADAWRARGAANANVRMGTLIALCSIPVNALLYFAPSGEWAAFWLAPAAFLAAAPFGVAPAAIQQMMPAAMRGQASAVYLFVINLIGLGLGPTAVAVTTQYIFRRDDALRDSLALVTAAACLVAAGLLRSAWSPYLGSLERLRACATAND
jgi:hypothetical protein